MRTLRLITVLSTLATSAVLQLGCAADESSEETSAIGTLRMPLTASSTSGATYRLRNATIDLLGPQFASIETEDHLGEPSVQLQLATGSYEAILGGGWVLEKEESGVFQPVSATLLSSNPQDFNILDAQNTLLEFVFRSDGDVIQIGEGTLEVVVRVEDETTVLPENTAARCSDGVDNDSNGLVDCGDPGCSSFCSPTGLLWSHEQPSAGPNVAISGGFDESVYFASGPVVSELIGGDVLWNMGAPSPFPIRDLAGRADAPEVIAASFQTGAGQVQVTGFMPGGGIMFHTPVPGPVPTSTAVRIAAGDGHRALLAYQFNSDMFITGLDPNGMMMWQRPLPGAGAPVQVSNLSPEFPGYGILGRPAGSFRGMVVDMMGNLMVQVSQPLPPDQTPLAFGTLGGGNFGVIVGRQMVPLLTRFSFNSAGGLLGVDEFDLPGPAVTATAGAGGIIAVSDLMNQLSVLDQNGELIAMFPAPAGHAYSELAFVSGDVVCGTGTTGGLSFVDCFGY